MEIKTKNWIDKHFVNDIKGQNIIVTGANSGIGFEFCRNALYKGANIFMAVRSQKRGEEAREKLLKEFPESTITLLNLDAANLKSINDFSNSIISNHIDVNALFLNAGVFNLDQEILDNEIERTFLTNYLSNYILIHNLLPYFKSLNHEVRIIIQSSITMLTAKVNEDDLQSINHFSKFNAYSNTKLFMGQLHSYLVDNHSNANIKFLLTHPGATYTPLIDKGYKFQWFRKIAGGFMKLIFHSPSKASLSSFILLDKNINNGDFYGPRGLLSLSGYPKKTSLCKTKREKYHKIISYSEKITKISFLS